MSASLKSLARSPYLLPAADVDALIAGRGQPPVVEASPEPDFASPEPMPVIDAPEEFAADFWRGRKLPGPNDEPPSRTAKPKRPKGRRPSSLGPRHDRFEVFDGGAAGDVDKTK